MSDRHVKKDRYFYEIIPRSRFFTGREEGVPQSAPMLKLHQYRLD